jgi:hypothetical protein
MFTAAAWETAGSGEAGLVPSPVVSKLAPELTLVPSALVATSL